ncbi:MAG: hypothetical protein HY823_01215 [Acidobacteria bacterium]|nr:hypothetical protein [Acidobacteriota bacterium]
MIPVLLPLVGPTIPLPQPLPAVWPLPRGADDELRARVRDLPGAVVVVEDTFLEPFQVRERNIELLRGKLRVFLRNGVPGQMGLPPWTDPAVTRSGGNVVHRVYSPGGVGF